MIGFHPAEFYLLFRFFRCTVKRIGYPGKAGLFVKAGYLSQIMVSDIFFGPCQAGYFIFFFRFQASFDSFAIYTDMVDFLP